MARDIEEEKTYEKQENKRKCKLINLQIDKLKNTNEEKEILFIIDNIHRNIEQIFGRESRELADVASILDKNLMIKTLEAFVEQLTIIGSSHTKKPAQSQPSFNINTNVTQSQTVQVELIQNILQEELPPSRFNEIKEILNTQAPEKTKLHNIIETLKKAGVEATSSVLAKIVTQLFMGS